MKKPVIIEICILIFIAIIVGLGVFFSVKHHVKTAQVYHLIFKDVDGIVVGSPVMMMGVNIGHVTSLKNLHDEMFVNIVVTKKDIYIPQGTVATVSFSGMAGSRTIELKPPKEKTETTGIVVQEPIRLKKAIDLQNIIAQSLVGYSKSIMDILSQDTRENTVKLIHTIAVKSYEADDIADFIDKKTRELSKNSSKHINRVNNSLEKTNIYSDKIETNIKNIQNTGDVIHIDLTAVEKALSSQAKNYNAIKEILNSTNNFIVFAQNLPQKIEKTSEISEKIQKTMENIEKNTQNYSLSKFNNKIKDIEHQSEVLNKNF